MKSEEGKGSEFSFTIPYGIADASQIPEQNTNMERNIAWLDGIRLLVAEDNEYNQVVIQDTLHTLIRNASVDIADNGKLAIEKLLKNDYDAILMDVQMPEMNGMEATAYIRQNMKGAKRDIPIIALTASVLNTDLDKCIKAGMNAYIPKPFRREELLDGLLKYYRNEKGLAPEQEQTVSSHDTPQSIAGKVSNLVFLREFCGGNKEQMQKYIDIYLKVTPGNLEKINAALVKQDYAGIAKTVHAMKAHLNYMGMKEARGIAEEIELLASGETGLEKLPQLISILELNCRQSVDELAVALS